MVWNELKRTVAREVPRTKQELQDCILRFWSTQMTAEKCATYIDHVFKVVPVCILMRGSATGDVPGKLFNERSRGKSIAYFQGRLADPDIQKKAASFVNVWIVWTVNRWTMILSNCVHFLNRVLSLYLMYNIFYIICVLSVNISTDVVFE